MQGPESLHISNPLISYRLDPGEPGMLRSARASDSAVRVTAQERRNLNRLVSDAYREGRIPVRTSISYDAGFEGAYMAVRGGHTAVTSVPDGTPASVDVLTEPAQPLLNIPDPVRGGVFAQIGETTSEEPGAVTLEELEYAENTLRVELALMRRERIEAWTGGGAAAGAGLEEPPDELETRMRMQEISRDLGRIMAEKTLRQMEDLQAQINRALGDASRTPMNLIAAGIGAGGEPVENGPPVGGIDVFA